MVCIHTFFLRIQCWLISDIGICLCVSMVPYFFFITNNGILLRIIAFCETGYRRLHSPLYYCLRHPYLYHSYQKCVISALHNKLVRSDPYFEDCLSLHMKLTHVDLQVQVLKCSNTTFEQMDCSPLKLHQPECPPEFVDYNSHQL